MENIISKGINSNLVGFDEGQKNIIYQAQNKKFRYSDPEEKVRAKAYVSLVLDYGYDPTRIDIEFAVPHRSPNIYADIIVFADKTLKTPLIVVECKREEASEGELEQAIEQGFGYANSLKAYYLWMTSGIRNDYFNVQDFPAMERVRNRLADLPRAGQKKAARAKYVKGGINGFELKIVDEAELTRIFKQAHDALWGGGKRNPAEAFDELDKLIFCKIWDERAKRKNRKVHQTVIPWSLSGVAIPSYPTSTMWKSNRQGQDPLPRCDVLTSQFIMKHINHLSVSMATTASLLSNLLREIMLGIGWPRFV